MSDDLTSDLINIVLDFISKMNTMELYIRDCSLKDGLKQSDWLAEFENKYVFIVEQYCTSKKRTYNRAGYSLEEPYYLGIDQDNDIVADLPNDKKHRLFLNSIVRQWGTSSINLYCLRKKTVGKSTT